MTVLGRWDNWYAGLDKPAPYGDTATYQAAADWLAGCSLVEDWGCGKGWMSRFIPPERYRGVDGSQTPYAAEIADLTTYRSSVAGIVMRHVLEHNNDWRAILENALASATSRLAVVLFTPLVPATREIAFSDLVGVPDLAFRLTDLTDVIDAAGWSWTAETMDTATQYGAETMLRCER